MCLCNLILGSKHGSSYKSHRNDCGSLGHKDTQVGRICHQKWPSQAALDGHPGCGSVLEVLSTSATLGRTHVTEQGGRTWGHTHAFCNISMAWGSVIHRLELRAAELCTVERWIGKMENSRMNQCRKLCIF